MMQYSYKKPTAFNPISFDQVKQGYEGVHLRSETNEPWIRKAPKFLDDPDRCGIFSEFQDQNHEYLQSFVLSVQDVKLVGVRTFLDKVGNWFNDQNYHPDELDHDLKKLVHFQDLFLNEWTGFRPTTKIDTFILEQDNRPEIELKGKTIVACCIESNNYGSWIFRVLPKVYSAVNLGLDYDHILIEHQQHTRLLEWFNLIGVDSSKCIQHDRHLTYKIEKAFIPSLFCTHAYLNQETQEFYKRMRSKYGLPSMGEKIYVSRFNFANEKKTTRVMQNEKTLMEALIKEGFKIVYPELLSVRAQIETFSSASVVVGPSGSGMFNVAFCHPGTKLIDIESEPHWIHAHLSLFSSLSLDFGIFVGKVDPSDTNPVHKRWNVNIPALMKRIRMFCDH